MTRLYVTGTDTGVGKTRITAALALAAGSMSREPATIVKLVQTGLADGIAGDAALAATYAQCESRELRRFTAPADPWSAALAQGRPPATARELATELGSIRGNAVVEGSGGVAVPLNAVESLSDVARRAGCETVVVVGLRLGCINHALLTLAYLESRDMPVRAAILCEAFGPVSADYRPQVERALVAKVRLAAHVAYDCDAARSIAAAALALAPLWRSNTARK